MTLISHEPERFQPAGSFSCQEHARVGVVLSYLERPEGYGFSAVRVVR